MRGVRPAVALPESGVRSMTTLATKTLERHALDAHLAGQTWADFWNERGADTCTVKPWNIGRYRHVVRRLLSPAMSRGILWQAVHRAKTGVCTPDRPHFYPFVYCTS